MIIRKYEPGDETDISALISRSLIELNSDDYSGLVIKNMCQRYSPPNIAELSRTRDIFIAEEDGKIVGTVNLEGPEGRLFMGVYALFVNPQSVKQGIGRSLMEHAEEKAKSMGFRQVRGISSLTARKFYEKIGYVKVNKTESEEYGSGLLMIKNLE